MVIADTGFWLALANSKDRYHERAKSFLTNSQPKLVTTWPVMTETCFLLLTRLGPKSATAFLNSYQDGAFEIFNLEVAHAPRMVQLMTKYADLPMDLADASLVVLAEYLGHGRILSTDSRDFKTYKWKNKKPFQNLLIPEMGH